MEKTEQMQQFSLAFVYAIAAQAGCNHSKPEVDDHSVDLKLLKNMPGHLFGRSRTQYSNEVNVSGFETL